ncbi:uncharacterized protein LTR77_007687 [Saxophila tyrrhenica]|uniref:Zn(2)-C6 fungal-type domain-containing protein n=1 Tax=Saxophila tyrrhenica TaxID=1690608 RepID=A0AAV9P6R4_9PEZI|nr:hypothetical protein LTR77_007687 [Saxophila tyrrhenica]
MGTAAAGGWARLDQYTSIAQGRHKTQNIHEQTLQQPDTTPKFSIVWSSTGANCLPVLALVVEGLLQCTLEPKNPILKRRFVSDGLRRLVRDFGAPNVNPDLFTKGNVLCSLISTAYCSLCDKEIKQGDKTRNRYTKDGYTRALLKCFQVERRQARRQFLPAYPKACARCRYHGRDAKCDGKTPCNECMSRQYGKRRLCKYGIDCGTVLRTDVSEEDGVPKDEKCIRCLKWGAKCNGKHPCGVCARRGDKCAYKEPDLPADQVSMDLADDDWIAWEVSRDEADTSCWGFVVEEDRRSWFSKSEAERKRLNNEAVSNGFDQEPLIAIGAPVVAWAWRSGPQSPGGQHSPRPQPVRSLNPPSSYDEVGQKSRIRVWKGGPMRTS